MNSEKLESTIRKLLLMPTSEIKELNKLKRAEVDQLNEKYKALQVENVKLTNRYAAAEKVATRNNKTREKMLKKVATLQENKEELQKKFNQFDEEMAVEAEKFKKSRELAKDVKKMYEEKCLSIRESRGEFKTQSSKLEAEIKSAEIELSHKKDSLAANQQVLESKMACFEKDREECARKRKELNSLLEKNYEVVLNNLEQREEDLKLEFSDLKAKLAGRIKEIENLDAEKASITVETDKITLELAVEEKCNQKLAAELTNEEENLEKLALEMVVMELNDIHCDNLELAKILRDDMIQHDENLKEIDSLELEKAEAEKNNQEFDKLKELKIEQLKQLQNELETSMSDKIMLENQVHVLKNYIINKEEITKALKIKIAEKEEALKKHNEEATKPKTTQLTVFKGTQLTNSQPTQSKTPKTARPKGKKSKEPQVSKPKESAANSVEAMSISIDEQSDPNVFSSSSSGESNLSFAMSSSISGK